MIIPPEDWTEFKSDAEAMDFLRKTGLITAKTQTIKNFCYKNDSLKSPVMCKVVGYSLPFISVILVNGQLHCIHTDHLKEMQMGMSTWIKESQGRLF